MESKRKTETQKMTSERDELLKQITKIEHKETQFRHEIKSKELQIAKLQDQLKQKLFDQKGAGKENMNNNLHGISQPAKIIASNDVKFSKMSADTDLNLMNSKSHEEMNKRLTEEVRELKDCLKQLQREMFDIVKLKSDIYSKRFKAENFKGDASATSEDILKNQIENIKEGLFNVNFEETGREIIHKF